jgi:hypothetical protein
MLVGLLQDGRVRHTPVLCKRIRSVLFLDTYADFRGSGIRSSTERHTRIIAKFSSFTIGWSLTLTAVALTVFGAKVLLIANYGSFVPFWDQWDGEAAGLYLPYLKGQLSFTTLLASHNEHRILLPRLLFLALLEFSGEWRPTLQMIVDAGFNACFAVLIASFASLLVNLQDRLLAAAITGLVLCLPLSWENTLAGFHAPWFLLVIFITLAITALVKAKGLSALWWAGVGAGVLAYFTIASGALAIVAASCVVTIQLLIKERRGAREFWALGLLLLIVAIMIAYTPFVPAHQQLKANGGMQFLFALLKLASWPLPIGIAIVQLPIAGLAYSCIVRRQPNTHPSWPLVGIGTFTWLQMASLAYGRAGGLIAPRYLDMLSVSVVLSFIAFVFLVRQASPAPVRRVWVGLLTAWTIAIGIGLAVATKEAIRGASERGRLYQLEIANVDAYLAGDRLALRDKPLLQIPYPQAERLEHLLDDPMVVAILPREFRNNQNGSEIHSHLLLKGRLSELALHLEKAILEGKYLFPALGTISFLLAWFSTRRLRISSSLLEEYRVQNPPRVVSIGQSLVVSPQGSSKMICLDDLDTVIRRKNGKVLANIPQLGLYAKGENVEAALAALDAKKKELAAELEETGELDMLENNNRQPRRGLTASTSDDLGRFAIKTGIVALFIAAALTISATIVGSEIQQGIKSVKIGGAQFWTRMEAELDRLASPVNDLPEVKKKKLLADIRAIAVKWHPFVAEIRSALDSPDNPPQRPPLMNDK